MISGDRNLLALGTEANRRLQLQRSQVEHLEVFVWPQLHSLCAIFQATQGARYDVVTAQDPFWRGLVAALLAHRSGAKLNIQVHTDTAAETKSKPIRLILSRIILRRADSVRVVSERIKKQIERYVKIPIAVLPIFINVEKFKNLPDRRTPSYKTILWIGRFEEEKDPLRAIAVLKEVLMEIDNARLIVLGTGSLEQKFSELAATLHLEHRIERRGWEPDPVVAFEIADVVLSTSIYESFGAGIIEALAAGVPVVAPDVGVAREAGAIIANRLELAQKVIEVLKNDVRGQLRLNLPNGEAWARAWKETL